MTRIEIFPKTLYKYRDWDILNHKKLLVEQELYFPSASKFNDPFEGAIPFEYDPKELTPENIFLKMYSLEKELYPDKPDEEIHKFIYAAQQKNLLFDPVHREYVNDEIKKQVEEEFGIFSLTTQRNNFLMWSHYSNSHKGFCIGFDTQMLYDSLDCALGKVDYQNTIPKFKLNEAIQEFAKKLIGTKGNFWSYEEEYRFVSQGKSNFSIIVPIDTIVEVILGCRMNEKSKDEIIDFISNQIPECHIYEAIQSTEYIEIKTQRIR